MVARFALVRKTLLVRPEDRRCVAGQAPRLSHQALLTRDVLVAVCCPPFCLDGGDLRRQFMKTLNELALLLML
jgi:hypothetical protein